MAAEVAGGGQRTCRGRRAALSQRTDGAQLEPASAEEVRLRRTAAAEGLRRDEAAGKDHPTAGEGAPLRSPRPADRTIHRHEQAGRSKEMASRAGQVPARQATRIAEEVTLCTSNLEGRGQQG